MKVTRADLSGMASIDALLSGMQWGNGTSGPLTLTVSFPYADGAEPQWDLPYTRSDEYEFSFGFSASQQEAALAALAQWAQVANLEFLTVTDAGESVGAIRFAFTGIEAIDAWWGWSYFPKRNSAAAGDVWVNAEQQSGDWLAGSEDFMLLAHEVGHALGLKHPFSGTTRLTGAEDSTTYTLMSYTDPADNLFRTVTGDEVSYRTIYPTGPMLYDIAAIQYLYGANMEFRASDDVYLFDAHSPFFQTIWDAGGTDSLSVESFDLGCRLDLRAGQFSDVRMESDPLPVGMSDGVTPTYDGRNNLAIAFGVTLENAYGGRGDDHITGNAADNLLAGNAGNDTLIGGTGADTLNGGAGDDHYYVESLADVVIESLAGGGWDVVDYSPTLAGTVFALGANIEGLAIDSLLAADATGNELDNTLYAGAGNNRLDGGDGLDTLSYENAGRGVKLTLAAGTDAAGSPVVQKTGGSGRDAVLNCENLTGSGFADALTGDAGANAIVGQGGRDWLAGGGGDDWLSGGAGSDRLAGGAGADRFVFDASIHARRNVDLILDFDPDEDRIVLDAGIFGALADRLDEDGMLLAEALLIGKNLVAPDDGACLIFDPASGVFAYDADGSGAADAHAFARISLESGVVDAGLFIFMP